MSLAARCFNRILNPLAVARAERAYRGFVAATRDATAAQSRLLQRQIARQADSDFGRQHGFARIRGYDDFVRAVPIAGYERFEPYIQRVARGERQALLGPRDRVLMFAMTSGTTGRAKYVPVTPDFLASYRRGWNVWGSKAYLDHPGSYLRSIVQVTSPIRDHETEAGIPCGAITGLLAATQMAIVRRHYAAPIDVARIGDSAAKYYTIMRLAIPRDVAMLVTANPATLLLLARTADAHREQIIRDIHDGGLDPALSVDAETRRRLAPRLRADRACARRLERLVERTGRLRPADYWRLEFVAHWTGGTMGLYRAFFPEWFGHVPVRDIGLLASEGRMTVPIADGVPGGVLDVTSQFTEFIPAESYGQVNPAALRCHELAVGREYFIVLTNASGLCRYDIGDRVRMIGWFGSAPVVEFLCKDAHTSSLTGEKLTENQVVMAIQRVAREASRAATCDQLVLAPQFEAVPYYRLYVDADVVDGWCAPVDLADAIDREFCELNVEYRGKRESQRLGPVSLTVLPPRYLAERDARLRAASSRSEQFKHQYLLPRPGMDRDWACVEA